MNCYGNMEKIVPKIIGVTRAETGSKRFFPTSAIGFKAAFEIPIIM